MHQQRPRELADRQPVRGQQRHRVAPGGGFVAAEPVPEAGPESAGVPAVGAPAGQPAPQVLVGLRQRPVPQALGDLARGGDDEGLVTAALDRVHPAGGRPAGPDAGRAEPRSHRERGDRVPGLVPGGLHGGGPGGGVAGGETALVPLPDPGLVHDRLVVVADQPGKLGLDHGQRPLPGWRQCRAAHSEPAVHDVQADQPAVGVVEGLPSAMIAE